MSETVPLLHSRPKLSTKLHSIFLESYINVLLIFVPLGLIAGSTGASATWVFLFNFLAIIPLAAILSYATEELSAKVGQTVGGLLNATFGNAVELIVAVIALYRGEIRIVQTSMLGSILSNTLLVLGCCFVCGGFNRVQQHFNQTAAQTMSSLMTVATSSLLLPAAFHATTKVSNDESGILALSRGTSIILLVVYVLYLVFQLKTHTQFFEGEQEEEQDGILSAKESILLLFVVTLAVAFCADYLVDSIDDIVVQTGISKTFIGLILLPIVGNAAEHVTAVIVSMKNKMDLAVGVSIGSSMQIALFMTPFLVVVGWVMDIPMSLYFSTFETAVMFISTILCAYVLQDGESNWLEGVMLISTYLIIAIAFFEYPDSAL